MPLMKPILKLELRPGDREELEARARSRTNRAPVRFVWKADGLAILEKINRARTKLGLAPHDTTASRDTSRVS